MGKVKQVSESFFRSRKNRKALAKKNGNGNKPAVSRKVLFEALEPRMLMSSDLAYTDTAAVHDLTLRYDDSSHKLQLIDNQTATAVVEQDLSETDAVRIAGSAADDALTIDFSSPFTVPGGISFVDASDSDRDGLKVIGDSPVVQMSGNTAGTINGDSAIDFTGIEKLKIGLDSPDVFGDSANPSFAQVFYLDLDGAQDITYDGPVTLSNFDVAGFQSQGRRHHSGQ